MFVLSLNIFAFLLPLATLASHDLVERQGSSTPSVTCGFANPLLTTGAPIAQDCKLQFLNLNYYTNQPGTFVPSPDGNEGAVIQTDENTSGVILASNTVFAFNPQKVNILCFASTNAAITNQVQGILTGLNLDIPPDVMTALVSAATDNPVVGIQCDLQFTVNVAKNPSLVGQTKTCTFQPEVAGANTEIAVLDGLGLQPCTFPATWKDVISVSVKFAGSQFPIQANNLPLSPGFVLDDFVFGKSSCAGYCSS
ncbi:hypothetical protein NA57DRAFT_60339 [Rhizodiscina lignyota]|uniref:Uncharacterized protein n=1 Tax=Rhizodiscina lignyota TaxID=1504668 RepID=A0A9P4I913_9PEZI|nr:hypothetical protein NA57DRAFT_60339 [Rhizodiscina lignyota]